MRIATTASFLFIAATQALAHPGHIAHSEGHDHYMVLGAAALAVAIGLGAFAVWRKRAGR